MDTAGTSSSRGQIKTVSSSTERNQVPVIKDYPCYPFKLQNYCQGQHSKRSKEEVNASVLVTLLVTCCCITKYPQTQQLKMSHIYHLTVSVSQESRGGSTESGCLVQSLLQGCSQSVCGALVSSEDSAGIDPLPHSLPWLLAGLSLSQAVITRGLSILCPMGLSMRSSQHSRQILQTEQERN